MIRSMEPLDRESAAVDRPAAMIAPAPRIA
jgi:hypothetical protein